MTLALQNNLSKDSQQVRFSARFATRLTRQDALNPGRAGERAAWQRTYPAASPSVSLSLGHLGQLHSELSFSIVGGTVGLSSDTSEKPVCRMPASARPNVRLAASGDTSVNPKQESSP